MHAQVLVQKDTTLPTSRNQRLSIKEEQVLSLFVTIPCIHHSVLPEGPSNWVVTLTFECYQKLKFAGADLMITDHLQMVILSIGYGWWSDRDPRGVWVYTIDGLGLFESNETTYFQFWALAEMIRLILPFWCSFVSLDDVSEQGDIFYWIS